MSPDMCVPCGDGLINLRAGALIVRDGKLLMVRSGHGYYYSVGGRLKFGETAEDAVVREVFEETGVKLEVDRLAFVEENYFINDMPANLGKTVYELGFYFRMIVPPDFEPLSQVVTEGESRERLCWVSPDTPEVLFPEAFRTEALDPSPEVRHFVKDDR
ncbi:MAG: NUDIX domain-containing protein [Ruminococcaceae bacterium]|nr:NUDIX domain-containing protein [Oscillospiraceae bacterium]